MRQCVTSSGGQWKEKSHGTGGAIGGPGLPWLRHNSFQIESGRHSMTNEPMSKTLFEKIIAREVPSQIVYEDDQVVAFRDIVPQAPTHVLIVPRKAIPRATEASQADKALLGHLLLKAAEVAQQLGLKNGFRLVFNNGPDAGEAVP